MQHYVDGADLDGDGAADSRMLADSIEVPVLYDVRFDFEIRGGTPSVSTSASPDPA
jgi:hypothetical protein